MDGRPKRIKMFAFTSVCVYNRLRVDGAFEYKSFQSSCSFENIASKFSYSHTFRQNEKETHELYKQENGKRKIKNSAAVFVDVLVLAA